MRLDPTPTPDIPIQAKRLLSQLIAEPVQKQRRVDILTVAMLTKLVLQTLY